jgi:hypothetical protein
MKVAAQSSLDLMRVFVIAAILLTSSSPALAQQRDYPRDLFNIGQPVSGTTPFPNYDPYRVDELYRKQHEVELQIFDVINEGALRRDSKLKRAIDLYGKDLGYIPLLAVAHYKYVFGEESQLDWLLAEDAKGGFARDSLVLIVFGYMDEWDRTIRRFKEHDKVADGAAAEILHEAMEIRKRIYGADRFRKAWNSGRTN